MSHLAPELRKLVEEGFIDVCKNPMPGVSEHIDARGMVTLTKDALDPTPCVIISLPNKHVCKSKEDKGHDRSKPSSSLSSEK
jgi:hypothetical protein